jgi:hypothetical protein
MDMDAYVGMLSTLGIERVVPFGISNDETPTCCAHIPIVFWAWPASAA